MKNEERWRLPDGVEEVLPGAAMRLEQLRRRITDLYDSWGYELVMPPLVEYLESLLTGSAQTLDLQTFKLVDQLTGKTMGVRADMTPQVARIDSHRLSGNGISRLFYIGSVLRTMPDAPGGSRAPLQLGAEIYGHAGIESDIEIIGLMLASMGAVGVTGMLLDLGHVGVYRGLVAHSGLTPEQESTLFDAMLRKSQPEINRFLARVDLGSEKKTMLAALSQLHGGLEVLEAAQSLLEQAGTAVSGSLSALRDIASKVAQRNPGTELHIDLSELRGYSYHTGVVFSVFNSQGGEELARGGRYDDIGAAFGRRRPATGFSADLKQLLGLYEQPESPVRGIFVKDLSAANVWNQIQQLRAAGERVVTCLPEVADGVSGRHGDAISQTAVDCRCDRQLVFSGGQWQVTAL